MVIIVLIIILMVLAITFFFIYGTKKPSYEEIILSEEKLNKEMKTRAYHCVQTAAAAFNKTLDYSEDSVRVLDQIITAGWKNKTISEDSKDKIFSIFSAYLGQTFIYNFGGKWIRKENETEPFVENTVNGYSFSPLRIIKDKFSEMTLFDLTIAFQEIKEKYLKF